MDRDTLRLKKNPFLFGNKKTNKFFYIKFIALVSRNRKSRNNILPPIGTRLKYISNVIRHNALPFIGNFCANSGVGSNPSDRAILISHAHTCARVHSRGSN